MSNQHQQINHATRPKRTDDQEKEGGTRIFFQIENTHERVSERINRKRRRRKIDIRISMRRNEN